MKSRMLALVAVAGLLFLFPGCTKLYDYIKDNPGEAKKYCRVQKLKVWWYSTYREINFIYNPDGNPTDMLADNLGVPGYSDNDHEYHWRYDKKGRVTDYYDNLRGSLGVFVWHRYWYPDKKRIVDTAFNYSGLITDPVPPNATTAHSYYAYINDLDKEGRIIRNMLYYTNPPYVTNFAYSLQGNLVKTDMVYGNEVPYDNKINVYQTHPVWKQIYEDYSLNNALPSNIAIVSYNEWGLPVKYKYTGIGYPGYLFGHMFDSLEVVYDCRKDRLNYD